MLSVFSEFKNTWSFCESLISSNIDSPAPAPNNFISINTLSPKTYTELSVSTLSEVGINSAVKDSTSIISNSNVSCAVALP